MRHPSHVEKKRDGCWTDSECVDIPLFGDGNFATLAVANVAPFFALAVSGASWRRTKHAHSGLARILLALWRL